MTTTTRPLLIARSTTTNARSARQRQGSRTQRRLETHRTAGGILSRRDRMKARHYRRKPPRIIIKFSRRDFCLPRRNAFADRRLFTEPRNIKTTFQKGGNTLAQRASGHITTEKDMCPRRCAPYRRSLPIEQQIVRDRRFRAARRAAQVGQDRGNNRNNVPRGQTTTGKNTAYCVKKESH